MKIQHILVIALGTGALLAQPPDVDMDGRVQLFYEFSQPVAITVVAPPASSADIQDKAARQSGIGVRFLGEIVSAPGWYYELGGRGTSSSDFQLNGPVSPTLAVNLTSVKVSNSYWSAGGAYIYRHNETLSLGAHAEIRGEALKAEGNLSWTGTSQAPVYMSTTYVRPWVRLSADYTFQFGSFRPYIGADAGFAITRTEQTQYVSLAALDERTLKAMAPRSTAAVYIGARF